MTEDSEGVRARIIPKLLEATDRESLSRIRRELIDSGEKEGTIDAVISELRKKGHLQFNGKPTALAKALPVEAIVENLPWPIDVDGHVDRAFVAGMRYEALNVIRGIRLAQELTKMGIDQATPIIKMAQEMRESEGQAAKIIAAELAEATLESNKQIMAAIGQQAIAQSPNPMLAMMVNAMQPMFAQAMGNLMGLFQPRQQPGSLPPPGSPPSQPNQPGEQPAPGSQLGSQQATEDEVKEAFGDG